GVRPDQLAERAQASGNEYTSLRNAVRRFIDVDAQSLPHDEVRAALEELAGRADGLDRAADPIPRWAYERAKKNAGPMSVPRRTSLLAARTSRPTGHERSHCEVGPGGGPQDGHATRRAPGVSGAPPHSARGVAEERSRHRPDARDRIVAPRDSTVDRQ